MKILNFYLVKIKLTLAVCAVLFMASCNVKSSYYQKQQAIPGTKWDYKFQPVFKIDITDTAAVYQTYFLMRHDESYPNSNIWFRLKIKGPSDSTFSEGIRIDKELADAEGKWKAQGTGTIYEHKVPLTIKESPTFKKPGTYEIKLEQIMRQNPLPSVLNVGINIEKK